MENILEINGVSKHFAEHTALNNVSLNVPKGSIFGLLGPNGAGKTTLIRIINQITLPDTGNVKLNGTGLNPAQRALIGYLPEERGLYRKMKVGEQCVYLAQLKGMSKADAMQKLKFWFDRFEITGWWNKKIEDLSKGMAQKIQFIVTVLHEPELLILDEPFSGFDPINTNLIKDEIMRLNQNGTTIIFSTHNMASVEEICNHIALINLSEKVLEGPVKQVQQDFKENIFEIAFKGNMIKFTNALWTGAEVLDTQDLGDEEYKVQLKLKGKTTTNNLLQGLIPEVEILGLKEILPSMNDIFIKAVTPQTTNV